MRDIDSINTKPIKHKDAPIPKQQIRYSYWDGYRDSSVSYSVSRGDNCKGGSYNTEYSKVKYIYSDHR